jgi:Protein of unknown function (DUF2950)
MCAAVPLLSSCQVATSSSHRTFATAEEAAKVLIGAVDAGKVDEVVQIFGPDGQELVDSSDPASARQNRQVFMAAVAEGWRLEDGAAGGKVLVIGNEAWPFPVPLAEDSNGWRFDAAAGREEIIARRIGRNELAAIQICRAYVTAQRLYARQPHDGNPPGRYAKTFRSDPGKENGLFWQAARGQKRSPLGDLLADAAAVRGPQDAPGRKPNPFYGYYFAVLAAQGAAASGGAKAYVVDGEMTAGFALLAWPARYDVTGVMTFTINHAGVVYEKDLGTATEAAASALSVYNPDASWVPVH